MENREEGKEKPPPEKALLRNLSVKWKNTSVLILAATFAISLILILLNSQFERIFSSNRKLQYEVGMVADRDIVVDRDIIYKDTVATELKKEAKVKLIVPIFQVNDSIAKEVMDDFAVFKETIVSALKNNSTVENTFLTFQAKIPGIVDKVTIEKLLQNRDAKRIMDSAELLLQRALTEGIVSITEETKKSFNSQSVEIWRWKNGKFEKEELELKNLITIGKLPNWIAKKLEGKSFENEEKLLIINLVSDFAREDCFLNKKETEKRKTKIESEVEPVVIKLVKGQVIARKGDVINEDMKAKIDALGEYSLQINLMWIIGSVLLLIITFWLVVFLFRERIETNKLEKNNLILISGVVLVYLLLSVVLSRFDGLQEWLPFAVTIPVATFTVMVTILVSRDIGIILSIVMALLILLIQKMDMYSALFIFLSGIAGTASVQKTEKRIDLIKSGLYIAAFNAFFIIAFGFIKNYDFYKFLVAVLWGLGNGFFSGILSLGFLPILEQVTNAPTRFRLLELSDVNAPPLKRMLMLAPGTYNHSVMVANLAEYACKEIGADPLIARVGAYYHDIGKVDQAEYFVENQRSFNKHDELKPSLSAAVIRSHVKIGIEKAKELKLPKVIIDIISQHHGKTLIKYFYQRAKDEEKNTKILPEDYSYPGERPKSKEAAVVMLADHVEAASRTLKKPSVAKLERLVWDVIMEKFTSGELNESNLTLRDLDVIKKSFVQILAGYFHTRIEYPKITEMDRA